MTKDKPDFFSITTVAERGQVVIPKEARDALNLSAGEKLVVLPSRHGNGILLMPIESLKDAAHRLSEKVDHMSEKSMKLEEKLKDLENNS